MGGFLFLWNILQLIIVNIPENDVEPGTILIFIASELPAMLYLVEESHGWLHILH